MAEPARASSPDAPVGARRLHIDWTRCDGRGLCTELLPELLGRDEWGYPVSRDATDLAARSEVVVPSGSIAGATDAVALCPRQALRLLESVPD